MLYEEETFDNYRENELRERYRLEAEDRAREEEDNRQRVEREKERMHQEDLMLLGHILNTRRPIR